METRPREGGHTIHDRRTCEKRMREKRKQNLGRETRREAKGDKGVQEGGHTIPQRETGRGTVEDKRKHTETRPSGRRRQHPTKGSNTM